MYRLLVTVMLAGVGWLLPHPALAQNPQSPEITSPPTQGQLVQPAGVFNQLITSVPSTTEVRFRGQINNRDHTVQVAFPTFVSGVSTDPDGTVRMATVTFPGGSVNSGEAPVNLPITPSNRNTTLTVSMAVTRPTIYPIGTYNYQVVVTVTSVPN